MIQPAFDERGLVPAIVQDAATGHVLMLAWMNAEALELTRSTNIVHFWSRSRQSLWKKGESSGNTLSLVELRLDCDADALLVRAVPAGPTCHTGATACFFHKDDGTDDDGVPETSDVLLRLAQILVERRDSATGEKSYTRSLLDKGMPKILEKIAEESAELAAELPDGSDERVVSEAADLLFHVMVGLTARRIGIERVFAELARRFGTSGHAEKAARSK